MTDNPIYYLMHNPSTGVVKPFILKDFLMYHPLLCYWIGLSIVAIEFLMIFLLFYRRTRLTAIYLGILFHITLILTLDVPAIFFFLFPPQLLLFINPDSVLGWIEKQRAYHQSATQKNILIYDGQCQFCLRSLQQLKVMDLFGRLTYKDLHTIDDFKCLHAQLTKDKAMSQLHLLESDGKLFGGFDVVRRISFWMPMLYPLIAVLYFPGMKFLGQMLYRVIAKNRYLFHRHRLCQGNACYRGVSY